MTEADSCPETGCRPAPQCAYCGTAREVVRSYIIGLACAGCRGALRDGRVWDADRREWVSLKGAQAA